MLKKIRTVFILFIALPLFVSGCASTMLVEPTQEELEAVRQFKKTLAIIDVADENSRIRDVSPTALSKLEEILLPSFNLVERERIENVLDERDFRDSGETQDYEQLGKMLGADYVAFGTTNSSLENPQIKSSINKNRDGNFTGKIWHEYCSQNSTGLKIVNVENGQVEYTDTKSSRDCRKVSIINYKDAGKYHKALTYTTIAQQIVQAAQTLRALDKNYSIVAINSLDKSVHKIGADLRRRFAQSGEILEMVSPKEVMVNLGSAYGIRPGDRLVVYEEEESIVDPKTGMIITPKVNKIVLKVTKVTSGLSALAKGSKKNIGKLSIGSPVYIY